MTVSRGIGKGRATGHWKGGISLDPEYGRWRWLKRGYGLSKEKFFEMLSEQKYLCPVCTEVLRLDISDNRNPEAIAVDHDHRTNKIRALLHGRCNRGIGFLRDDPKICRQAAEYLEKHSAN